ncbi:MAG: hypothetical protein HUJ58_01295 [Erysipelotrichaceae bacterium]|nr:hypothetical protein [Erysipelotrichaceae bacterium]
MKKLIITLILLSSLFACSAKIKYDTQYGVSYLTSSDTFIYIWVDPNDSETISKMRIAVTGDLMGDSHGMGVYKTDKPSDEDGSIPVEYEKNEYQESILIRFYSDNMKKEDLKAISEYLGYEFTSKTSIYDFVKSDTFRYKEIIETGEFINDISFEGNTPFKGDLGK